MSPWAGETVPLYIKKGDGASVAPEAPRSEESSSVGFESGDEGEDAGECLMRVHRNLVRERKLRMNIVDAYYDHRARQDREAQILVV